MSRIANLMLGAFLGGLLGSTLGLLLAPSSGEDLRRQAKETISQIQNEMQEAANARRVELEKQLADLRTPQK
jgi:gas vesicle protein